MPDRFAEAAPSLKGPPPVIDLTGDEDTEMARALEASLQTPSNPQFGPAPKSTNDWQVAIRPNVRLVLVLMHDNNSEV